jgi:hypothetical protein
MLCDPAHPDTDRVADDSQNQRGEYHPPDPDFGSDLHLLHGAHHGCAGGLRCRRLPGASAVRRLRLASGSSDRRPIDHRDLGFFGTAIGALINDLVPAAVNGGLDRTDHHEAIRFAIRTIEIGRKQIADLVEVT